MKTLARKGFLLLVLLAAITNSVEIPDLVEELDGVIDSPYMKFNTKKADDGDDAMSDDTSSSTDEDKEMMETADTSHVRF